jgi:hypothetical protein
MPVTLLTANHPSRKWNAGKVTSAEELLQSSCPKEYRRSKDVIQSSFLRRDFREAHISGSQHGFVRAVYHAYSGHHHLILRPEDVWFSVLVQLSFHINAHAEELRSFFVAHEGRKELVHVDIGTMGYADFGAMAVEMTKLIEKNVLDPDLRAWIMPAFSTTTDSDRVVAAILMMGSLQKYFSYGMHLVCGIPTVTLLGERDDWASMLAKLEKIPQLGEEPARFVSLLRPVLRHFVASFDNPTAPEVLDFWTKCVHETGGSGPYYLSGWITAFCFWKEDGECLYGSDGQDPIGPVSLQEFEGHRAGCELDGVLFHRVDTGDIPPGFASVPVTVNDNGDIYHTMMVAGSVGIQATSSGSMLDSNHDHGDQGVFRRDANGQLAPIPYIPAAPTDEPGLDTIQPLSGWWMYEKEGPEEAEAREQEKKAIEDELAQPRKDSDDHDRRMELVFRYEALTAY